MHFPKSPRHLSIADLYNDSVFPARFAVLASQKTGETANSIAYFIKGQIEGRTAYATNDNTIEALYQVAEMNEEWELLCRAENLIQQLP